MLLPHPGKSAYVALTVALGLLAGPSIAQDLFVYPEKGQSSDQQQRDEFECYKWAKSQSGVDPSAAPAGPDRGQRAGGTVKGAAKGAAAGALIGAIAGDAGKGAAIGAAGGGLLGHKGARDAERAGAAGERNAYQRAFAACMGARGYAVR